MITEDTRKQALVLGAGGFIGGHLVKRLISEGYRVVAVDIKKEDDWFQWDSRATSFGQVDLSNLLNVDAVFRRFGDFDEIYQLAADMGGAGYIFTGENDADVMCNSASINLNVLRSATLYQKGARIFYSSSACIYPERNQLDPENPICKEDTAYPADPDSEYGWEKLFSERMYKAFERNHGLDVRIARFHNIYGPHGTYDGGKEKAPAAMCRKAMLARWEGEPFEIWGTGEQTRSFLYIEDCLDAVRQLMNSDCKEVLNIGSEEKISIDGLANMVLYGDHDVTLTHIEGPIGVNGRVSDNTLIRSELGWQPKYSLEQGMRLTYEWIKKEMGYTK